MKSIIRNEEEVLAQLLGFAEKDDRVRVVLLNGSRVNPNVKLDILCDYDVIYGVTDVPSFIHNQDWISHFGELMIIQQNRIDDSSEPWYIFLMQFMDGVRIDLSIRPAIDIIHPTDSLTKLLMDKDGIMGALETANDSSYVTTNPTKKQYDEAVNDIWWCSKNVAKGLWRGELPYAKYMLDTIVRERVVDLLSWYVGMNNAWNCNVGKAGRWLERFLPDEIWSSYVKTYAGSEVEQNWEALFEVGRLVRGIGTAIADELGYDYPLEEDLRVTEYLVSLRLSQQTRPSL